jgi:hypothetical protein
MKRFNTTTNGYRYDKLIFYGILFLYLSFIFFIAYSNGFDFSNKVYFECVGWEDCDNPFYNGKDKLNPGFECSRAWLYGEDCNINKEEWFNYKLLPPGKYGKEAPNYFKYILPTLLIIIVFGLLLNHFLHNKGKEPELEIKISENKKININSIFKRLGDNIEEEK